MSFINYSSREINCKIVYYGPGLCGKTTNLQFIYNKTNPDAKGKMISLATETERTRDLEKQKLIAESQTQVALEQKQLAESERKKSDILLLNILPDEVARELKTKGENLPETKYGGERVDPNAHLIPYLISEETLEGEHISEYKKRQMQQQQQAEVNPDAESLQPMVEP